MRHEVRPMNLPRSVAIGTPMRIDDMQGGLVFLGTEAGVAPIAVVRVEAQVAANDFQPSEWIVIATLTNATGATPILEGYTRLRLNVTGYTSGLIIAAYSGKNSRTDG